MHGRGPSLESVSRHWYAPKCQLLILPRTYVTELLFYLLCTHWLIKITRSVGIPFVCPDLYSSSFISSCSLSSNHIKHSWASCWCEIRNCWFALAINWSVFKHDESAEALLNQRQRRVVAKERHKFCSFCWKIDKGYDCKLTLSNSLGPLQRKYSAKLSQQLKHCIMALK